MVRRLLGVGLLVLAAGCGSAPATGTVQGEVKLDGKPVPGGRVSLLSAAGGTPVMAEISADGKYRASEVPVGEVLVAVIAPPDNTPDAGEIIKNRGAKGGPITPPPAPAVKFPPKYADNGTSGLKVTVTPESAGPVTFDVAMTSR